MKKLLFLLSLLLYPFVTFADARPMRLSTANLKFEYVPYAASGGSDCKQTLQDAAAQDWLVECTNEAGGVKKFVVHLWATIYTPQDGPKLELLYWITDVTDPNKRVSHSQTTWLHFEKEVNLKNVTLNEGVDNDSAYLRLTLKLR